MSKGLMRHTKLLVLTVAVMLVFLMCVYAYISFSNFGRRTFGVAFGTFINAQHAFNDYYWSFSAGEADGYIEVFVDFDWEVIDNLLLKSSLSSGAMTLVIATGETNQLFDLSNDSVTVTSADYTASWVNSDKIEMRVDFVRAEDVFIYICWLLDKIES